MLLSLQIENFALIDALTIELGAGLNVLTGETGAGKSIILDAIDAVLGGRVTSRVIRTGAERATIAATFAVTSALAAWLRAESIEPQGDRLTIAVEIGLVAKQDGSTRTNVRSKFRVDDTLVVKATILRLRDRLVELAAQGQTVQLLQPENQRDWLDRFGGRAIEQQRDRVTAAYQRCHQASQALENRRALESQRLQQRDLLQFQYQELSAAGLSDPDELSQLVAERDRLAHVVDLQHHSYQVYQMLYAASDDRESCADLLAKAEQILERMTQVDRQAEPILEMVSSALAQVVEAGQQVNAYGERLESDPDRLTFVEERLIFLKALCRKYGPSLATAIDRLAEVTAALQEMQEPSQSLEALSAAYEAAYDELLTACDRLNQLRQTAARQLETQLVAQLTPLAMERVQFHVLLEQIPATAYGSDRVVYCFSPNLGEPLQPLGETASGGEMSRFLLALKACFSQVDTVETLVFDEIDVGVSGRVAQAIAEKLHLLSQQHQVLCVTHQPIVAAMADHHYHVDKEVIADENQAARTVVRLSLLEGDRRRSELAQLVSGADDPSIGLIPIAGSSAIPAQAAERPGEIDSQVGPGLSAAQVFAESLLDRAAHLRRQTTISKP